MHQDKEVHLAKVYSNALANIIRYSINDRFRSQCFAAFEVTNTDDFRKACEEKLLQSNRPIPVPEVLQTIVTATQGRTDNYQASNTQPSTDNAHEVHGPTYLFETDAIELNSSDGKYTNEDYQQSYSPQTSAASQQSTSSGTKHQVQTNQLETYIIELSSSDNVHTNQLETDVIELSSSDGGCTNKDYQQSYSSQTSAASQQSTSSGTKHKVHTNQLETYLIELSSSDGGCTNEDYQQSYSPQTSVASQQSTSSGTKHKVHTNQLETDVIELNSSDGENKNEDYRTADSPQSTENTVASQQSTPPTMAQLLQFRID